MPPRQDRSDRHHYISGGDRLYDRFLSGARSRDRRAIVIRSAIGLWPGLIHRSFYRPCPVSAESRRRGARAAWRRRPPPTVAGRELDNRIERPVAERSTPIGREIS